VEKLLQSDHCYHFENIKWKGFSCRNVLLGHLIVYGFNKVDFVAAGIEMKFIWLSSSYIITHHRTVYTNTGFFVEHSSNISPSKLSTCKQNRHT
jgi:hypothetical protein